MRDIILTYLTDNAVTGFGVSDKLPFDQNGDPLYLQNLKQLYVTQPQTEQEPLFDTLDDCGVVQETTTAEVYVITDAKTLPSNYDALVTAVKGVRNAATIQGYTGKAVSVNTSIQNDQLQTRFDLEYTKLIT